MTREEMKRVLGTAIGDGFIDLLIGYGVAHVDVIHERPLLEGPLVITKATRDQLQPARYSSGRRKTFTGHQMAGHRRAIKPRYSEVNSDFRRYYFDQRGGRTVVTLRVGDADYVGEARVWHEDTFIKEDGRRLALVRAILKIGGNIAESLGVLATATLANPADPLTGIFPCKEHSVAPRPKPRFGLGSSVSGKMVSDIGEIARRLGLSTKSSGPPHLARGGLFATDLVFPVGNLGDLWREVFPQHVILRARSLRKLREAEQLDTKSEEKKTSKKERKRLRRRAQILREQAIADAGIATQMEPRPSARDTSMRGKRADEVVFDEYLARNEA